MIDNHIFGRAALRLPIVYAYARQRFKVESPRLAGLACATTVAKSNRCAAARYTTL
jgi:hypothetical protein